MILDDVIHTPISRLIILNLMGIQKAGPASLVSPYAFRLILLHLEFSNFLFESPDKIICLFSNKKFAWNMMIAKYLMRTSCILIS